MFRTVTVLKTLREQGAGATRTGPRLPTFRPIFPCRFPLAPAPFRPGNNAIRRQE